MSKILIVAIAHDRRDEWISLALDYAKRTAAALRPSIKLLPPLKNAGALSDQEQKGREGALLLAACEGRTIVALDASGLQHNSLEFATELEKLTLRKPIAFVIGGAGGLSDEVLQKAAAAWSLSRLTFPHKIALCLLTEQIYRAGEIKRGGPYHK